MSAALLFRQATEADWPCIINIYNQAIDDGNCTADTEHVTLKSRGDWFRLHSEKEYPLYVICRNQEVCGWSSLSPFRHGRKALEKTVEISYYLDRRYRGKGIGTELMRSTISLARELGHQHLFAILLGINSVSIRLLERFDFAPWGRMPGVADFGEKRSDLLIYGRAI